MNENNPAPPVNPMLVELLRCPVALHENKEAEDPGRLRLVGNYWLVCDDSGMKYPIKDGIPIMLSEEGRKCVAIHRAHQEHVPNCMRPLINKKLKLMSELTEHTLANEIEAPHEILRK